MFMLDMDPLVGSSIPVDNLPIRYYLFMKNVAALIPIYSLTTKKKVYGHQFSAANPNINHILTQSTGDNVDEYKQITNFVCRRKI